MKARPRELTLLAIALIMIVVAYPAQIAVRFGDLPWEIGSIAAKLAPLNWACMILAVGNAVALYLASSWALFLTPVFLFTIAWNNTLVTALDPSIPWYLSCASTCATILLHSLMLSEPAFGVLTHPRSRWWLVPRRTRVSLDARITPVLGGVIFSKTFDLSESGAFISFQDATWGATRPASLKNIKVGSYCSIRLKLNDVSALNCSAEVVRKAPPAGTYPGGFGVRFVGLSVGERRALNAFLRTQGGIGVAPMVS
jgi:hypothetical protein